MSLVTFRYFYGAKVVGTAYLSRQCYIASKMPLHGQMCAVDRQNSRVCFELAPPPSLFSFQVSINGLSVGIVTIHNQACRTAFAPFCAPRCRFTCHSTEDDADAVLLLLHLQRQISFRIEPVATRGDIVTELVSETDSRCDELFFFFFFLSLILLLLISFLPFLPVIAAITSCLWSSVLSPPPPPP